VKNFESIADSLAPHQSQALLLLEVDGGSQDLSRALEIIKGEADDRLDYQSFGEDFPRVILVRLSPGPARAALLRLIQHGFTTVKTIYPQSQG
jgi:hypothetical protein